jgi:hypothetical protein
MIVHKIQASVTDAADVPALLNKANVPFERISHVNWKEYPYKPDVRFRIAHTDDSILIHYHVSEDTTRAKYEKDNDPVWTDSCVEFFSIPGGDHLYYNLECNCIGTILLAVGPDRNHREHATPTTLSLIKRWAFLGHHTFEEHKEPFPWEVALIIPYAAFFKHHITSLDGVTIKANFYKCGDELATPHFLSWNPINIEKPDFHRPDFFGDLQFEK